MKLRLLIRRAIGWCVGMFYVTIGTRKRALAQYRHPGTILSIFSHNPSHNVLEGVILWLKRKGFTFISTDELLDIRDGKREWKPLTAWLTFDDGWQGFPDNLLPVLEKYSVPATVFVAPNETKRGYVWLTLGVMEAFCGRIKELFAMPSDERYEAIGPVIEEHNPCTHLMDEDEIRKLSKHRLITIENHTWSHLSASHRPVDEVVSEIQQTEEVISDWTGRRPRMVCYPFGHRTHETDIAIEKIGLVPVTSIAGLMDIKALGINRNMFTDDMSLVENVGRILGAWPRVGKF